MLSTADLSLNFLNLFPCCDQPYCCAGVYIVILEKHNTATIFLKYFNRPLTTLSLFSNGLMGNCLCIHSVYPVSGAKCCGIIHLCVVFTLYFASACNAGQPAVFCCPQIPGCLMCICSTSPGINKVSLPSLLVLFHNSTCLYLTLTFVYGQTFE